MPMSSVLTIAPAIAWTRVSYDRRLTAEPLWPDIPAAPGAAGLPGNERTRGGAEGARCVSSVWERLCEGDKHRLVQKLSNGRKKVVLKKIMKCRARLLPLAAHWPSRKFLLRHFLVKTLFLLFFFVDFFFIVLQPLIDAKVAAPDRTVNVIRITYCKGLSINSFWRHYILGV